MVPTLAGRVQTRLFLLLLLGGVVTALITPVLPADGSLSDRYQTTFVVLATVTVLGVGWELIYHLLMQWRWEKDWPTMFGLFTAVPEGLLVWVLVDYDVLPWLPGPVPLEAFLIHFGVVWLVVWLFANGPMRVLFIRWRFNGGRVL